MKKRRIDDAFFLLAIDRRRALPFPASSLLFCTPRLPGRFEHVEKSAPKWGKMRRKRGVRGRERERESSTSTTTPFSLNLLSPTPTPTPPPTSESLTLRDLTDCSVYVLDHSSEVEASNCKNCQLFVGPVDGAAIFDACDGCTVAVASQQFQARKCSDTEFGVYCATAPTVRNCKGVRVGCWVSKRGGGEVSFFSFFVLGFFFFLSFFFENSQNSHLFLLALSKPASSTHTGRSLPRPHAPLRRGQPRPGLQPVAESPRRHARRGERRRRRRRRWNGGKGAV